MSGSENDSETENDESFNVNDEEEVDSKQAVKGPLEISVKKVFIVHKSIEKEDWKYIKSFMLPNPRTSLEALYLVNIRNEANDKPFIFEALSMTAKDNLSSWFIGDSVVSDGTLFTFAPIDPLLFIIPAMIKSTKTMTVLDHLGELYPNTFAKLLVSRVSKEQLKNIATHKELDTIDVYKFNEELTLNWLAKKTERANEYFFKRKITFFESSISSNFNKELDSDKNLKSDCLRYACDLISENIVDSLKVLLFQKLGVPIEQERQKRKNVSDENEEDRKKLKSDVEPLEDYGTSNKLKTPKAGGKDSAKQKQLQKAAQGTHSLLKFFSAKTK